MTPSPAPALTPEALARLRWIHVRVAASIWDIPPSGGADDYRCRYDGADWPCPVLALLDDLDRLEARVGELEARPDYLDGAREEYQETKRVGRMLAYLWTAELPIAAVLRAQRETGDAMTVRDAFANGTPGDPLLTAIDALVAARAALPEETRG